MFKMSAAEPELSWKPESARALPTESSTRNTAPAPKSFLTAQPSHAAFKPLQPEIVCFIRYDSRQPAGDTRWVTMGSVRAQIGEPLRKDDLVQTPARKKKSD